MDQIRSTGSRYRFFALSCLLYLLKRTEGIAIDNGVAGQPQVECSEDSVTFSFRADNRFTGNVFIKGKYDIPQCRQEYFSNTFNGASFTVQIGQCGMRRIRQLQPVGMNYMLVFVVNFHNQFITKIDRAYNVRCFYAQEDKTVTQQLEVSVIPTTEVNVQTILMPNCIYSVRQDTLNGPEVRFTQVGQRLVHRWECDNPNFGMLVKNCFVNDGQGSSVRVLDSRGCPVFTPVVQGNLNYDANLNLAYVEVWAYKFPDRANLYYQCQIQVCNKRENECVGITPPNCPLNPNSGDPGVLNPGGGTQYPYPQSSIGIHGGYPGGFQPNVGVGVNRLPTYSVIQPGQPGGVNQAVIQPVPGGIPGSVSIPYLRRRPDEGGVGPQTPADAQPASIEEAPVLPAILQNRPPSFPPAGGDQLPTHSSSQFAGTNLSPKSLSLDALRSLSALAARKAAAKSRRDVGNDPAVNASVVPEWEGNTLDVASDTLFIVDVEDAPEAVPRGARGSGPQPVCLNPASVGLLATTFILLVSSTIFLVGYVWLQQRRSKECVPEPDTPHRMPPWQLLEHVQRRLTNGRLQK